MLLFLVNPCLVVAFQSSMEWIPVKKEIKLRQIEWKRLNKRTSWNVGIYGIIWPLQKGIGMLEKKYYIVCFTFKGPWKQLKRLLAKLNWKSQKLIPNEIKVWKKIPCKFFKNNFNFFTILGNCVICGWNL